ncbi:MAG: MBL fold metallo-hydrolase [Candidatus Abyssobacteria bacterium SURF_17]|jgi:L-ascorbate metabolism protein UlaG (beta-lactamase superfamily)|uniref:MBL fold metallo-hydrolase n=1 Tax=Candidatus Abyssobacteria bacterium SURF_17 TaxID=2093361 RepID=A0A419F4A8_9BACT|nr:MAG: MBL fold metallo-hydrolase [Candidatus Abyssubacteria bacterium SURF_17]
MDDVKRGIGHISEGARVLRKATEDSLESEVPSIVLNLLGPREEASECQNETSASRAEGDSWSARGEPDSKPEITPAFFRNVSPPPAKAGRNGSRQSGKKGRKPSAPAHSGKKAGDNGDTEIGNGNGIFKKVIEAFHDDRGRILDTIARNEEKLRSFTSKQRSIPPDAFSFFSVLRKWNSHTPILPSEKGDNHGGGYFLYIRGKDGERGRGIAIDPGFNFVENLYEEGFKASDIDAVLISHAHNDHTVDLESILTLVHVINKNTDKKRKKKIDLFLNLGTFIKYSGWLNVHTSSVINEINVLHCGNVLDLSEKYNGLKIHAVKAQHHEIIDDKYCLGFVLEVDGCTIALTGDTGWRMDNSIAAPYAEHKTDLMVAHLGSIKRTEFDYLGKKTEGERQKCLYAQHLGLLGTGAMLHTVKPKLAVISEFGEELKPLRKDVVEKFDEVLNSTRCIPGEVGLHIRIPDLSVFCIVHRDFVPFQDIRIFNRPDQSNLYYYKEPANETERAEIYDLARELASQERAVSLFERLKRGPVKIR